MSQSLLKNRGCEGGKGGGGVEEEWGREFRAGESGVGGFGGRVT